MSANGALKSAADRRTYYPQTRTASLLMWGGLLLATLAIWVTQFVSGDGQDRFRAFLGIAYVLFSCLYLYRVWHDRVVVSSAGLEYYRGKYCIATPWTNIERIAMARTGVDRVEVLMLREPSLRLNNWLTRLGGDDRLKWLEREAKFIPPGKAIPISLDYPNWRTSRLGQDIRSHVPQLMSPEN